MQKQALNDFLLSLVSADGTAVGNQTLRDQFLKAAASTGFIAPGQRRAAGAVPRHRVAPPL